RSDPRTTRAPSRGTRSGQRRNQWQDAYPTEISRGTSRLPASDIASSPHSHQSTGLVACWRRYGDTAPANRFTLPPSHAEPGRCGQVRNAAAPRARYAAVGPSTRAVAPVAGTRPRPVGRPAAEPGHHRALRPRPPRTQEVSRPLDRHRLREVEPLCGLAPDLDEHLPLRRRLHALGHHAHTEVPAEPDGGPHD